MGPRENMQHERPRMPLREEIVVVSCENAQREPTRRPLQELNFAPRVDEVDEQDEEDVVAAHPSDRAKLLRDTMKDYFCTRDHVYRVCK
ncbi:hypothetical protein Q1695_006641 [Nippostrongylus brasiliensis]|nr:hypothetical protein Q1695_006641 [Nippostrongylus brasiliensis]